MGNNCVVCNIRTNVTQYIEMDQLSQKIKIDFVLFPK